jgi:REP element-mobilizing transposase RayT
VAPSIQQLKNGAHYFVTFVNDFNQKDMDSQVLEELKKFTRKKITNIRIKVLRIENGGECLSSKFL